MVSLMANQSKIGDVLLLGQDLVNSDPTSKGEFMLGDEEKREVKEQMELLNSRWEAIRQASMSRQTE